MANRLEATCWDVARNAPVAVLEGISHVTVLRRGEFLTDSMLEAHRINSPYLLEGKDRRFFDALKAELGGLEAGPINRKRLAQVLLRFDVGSLIHGVFLAKPGLAGGRLRVARALSAFIEASGVSIAASGGVKNDHVNPSGEAKSGFGNVPFARDEYVAERIDLYVNLDLAQIRGYGLPQNAESLLILLALHRVRRLVDGDLRLRTACDLELDPAQEIQYRYGGFVLPPLGLLEEAMKAAIASNRDLMTHTTVAFEDELRKGKDAGSGDEGAEDDVDADDSENS
jgi:CRISPR-associated protein Csb1